LAELKTDTRADQRWPWWPLLLPLYPYGRRRSLTRCLIPEQIWAVEQLQGVCYVAVPIRMTVVSISHGLMLYAPVPPTGEVRQTITRSNCSGATSGPWIWVSAASWSAVVCISPAAH